MLFVTPRKQLSKDLRPKEDSLQVPWQRKAKDLFWQTLYLCGGFDLLHSINGTAKILMYHRFDNRPSFRKTSIQTFENQIRMLIRRFSVISLAEYTAILKQGRIPDPNSVVLTFDDGYQDFYHCAFPILQKYGLPATLFVTTDFIDGNLWMWPDMLEYTLLQSDKTHIQLSVNGVNHRFGLNSYYSRMYAWNAIADHCLTVNNQEKYAVINQVAQACDVPIPDTPSDDYKALSWNHLRHMADNNIEIGSHTVTHPVLSKVEKAEQLVYEIRESKNRIAEKLQRNVNSFAYPNGTIDDYNVLAKQAIKNAGYQCAVVSYPATLNFKHDFLFELGRNAIGEDIVCFRKKIYNVERPFIRYHGRSANLNRVKGGGKQHIQVAGNSSRQNEFSLKMITDKHKNENQRKL